jgi:hypothetical protein
MGFKLAVRTNVVVNTKRYASVEEMPPEARRLYESVLASLPHLAPSVPRPDPALQAIEPAGARDSCCSCCSGRAERSS